jgi:hypothetical protein
MKTDNSNSEKDLNANPESRLNTNKPVARPTRFPESQQAKDEMEKLEHEQSGSDSDIELLAGDVAGTVSERETGSNPDDIAGISDLDRGMRRSRRR